MEGLLIASRALHLLAGTVPDSEPAFAELCPGDGIGSARLSFAGTPFPILTTGVRTSLPIPELLHYGYPDYYGYYQ
jgi:hypothetical protein